MNIAKIYKKFKSGGNLSNSELLYVLSHFIALDNLLVISGPIFELAAKESASTVYTLVQMKMARGI